ncbi:MAG: DUF6473 family protein [Roseovarius sp.]
MFRGPHRRLEGEFIACLGGTETFGKFVSCPYPDLLEEQTAITCVNFGWPNAGIDVFAHDRALLDCAGRARLCILQVPCATNMSNRYYSVHPRRNDRFLRASEALRALFGEVDFCEFSFTRHMLGHLQACSAERFALVRRELARVWVEGMRALIARIEAPVVLLWLSARSPDTAADRPEIWADPALVDRAMLEALRGDVAAIVEVCLGEEARGADPAAGHSPQEMRAARALPNAAGHRRIARALGPVVSRLLDA